MIVINNISYKSIISDVSFSLKQGEAVSILGSSGSGKSTLLKLIAGLIKPSLGDVIFEGRNIGELNIFDYRQMVRYVFPKPQFIQGSVGDHFREFLKLLSRDIRTYSSKIKELLADFKLDSAILDKKTSDVSTGEAKRLYLIQNLLIPAEVYLLDEAFSGIDHSLVNQLYTHLKNSSKALIVTTHNLSLASFVGKTSFFIKEGKIICKTDSFYEGEKNPDIINYIKGEKA